MALAVKQISSLEKVRLSDAFTFEEIGNKKAFKGERFSYQLALFDNEMSFYRVSVEGDCSDWVTLYSVKNAVMDNPIYPDNTDPDYITREPGLMPDILLPIEEQNNIVQIYSMHPVSVWVKVDVPKDAAPGPRKVTVKFREITNGELQGGGSNGENREYFSTMDLEVLPVTIPSQETIFTQWFHTDCIAKVHDVEIYSEEHWNLIDRYMACAADVGINMILTPVITPPLDTMFGIHRPNVQLLEITKEGDTYKFDFSKFHRFIALCKKNGIRYFEMCQLFSQWGMKYTPNIWVTENGKEKHLFGWHKEAGCPEYLDFLSQMLPALTDELEKEGIKENTYFHISDEPSEEHLEKYERFSKFVSPLIKGCRRMDALSNVEFFEKGLLDVPVTASNHMTPFLEKQIPDQWTYYCVGQLDKVSNRFLSMPSYRNRIMGLQMYRNNVKGFLQWGFNYYYSRCSGYCINPYQTTSADMAFPSGDPFSVYPGKNGPVLSLRTLVFQEGLEDISVCRLLESYIGKAAVCDLIDKEAGMKVDFENYPRSISFIPNLRDKMTEMIMKCEQSEI